jgi:membrane-associated phospholipid phosphatase
MRYAVVAIWPIGMLVILAISLNAFRRNPSPRSGVQGSGRHRSDRRRIVAERAPGEGQPAEEAGSGRLRARMATLQSLDGLGGAAAVLIIAALGALAVFGVTCLLGVLVVHEGPKIDHPIYNWMSTHQVHFWKDINNRLTKIGDTWTTWGAGAAAGVCLAITWQRRRWLPALVMGTVIFVDHYTTLALRHVFHRLGPPDSPLGTYPSGGVDRTVLFFGIIAYMLWHHFGGSRRAAIWAYGVMAALTFNEVYSRIYLGKHWFTDALSGVVYGALLLGVFVAAVRLIEGPAKPPTEQPPVGIPRPAAAWGRVSPTRWRGGTGTPDRQPVASP